MTMSKTFDKNHRQNAQKKHERIKKCTKELFAEDMGLQALSKALKLTQKKFSQKTVDWSGRGFPPQTT